MNSNIRTHTMASCLLSKQKATRKEMNDICYIFFTIKFHFFLVLFAILSSMSFALHIFLTKQHCILNDWTNVTRMVFIFFIPYFGRYLEVDKRFRINWSACSVTRNVPSSHRIIWSKYFCIISNGWKKQSGIRLYRIHEHAPPVKFKEITRIHLLRCFQSTCVWQKSLHNELSLVFAELSRYCIYVLTNVHLWNVIVIMSSPWSYQTWIF